MNKSKISYFKNFFKAILKFKRITLEVTVNGKTQRFEKAYFVGIQNGKYFGGGMKGAPFADITSDEFEVLVAHNLNNFLIQLLFITIYSGLHRHLKRFVTFIRGKEITIKLPDNHYFQTDGEVHGPASEIHIKKVTSREIIAFNKKEFKNDIAKKFHSN